MSAATLCRTGMSSLCTCSELLRQVYRMVEWFFGLWLLFCRTHDTIRQHVVRFWLSANSLKYLVPLQNGGCSFVGCSYSAAIRTWCTVRLYRSSEIDKVEEILFCLRHSRYFVDDASIVRLVEPSVFADGAEMSPDSGELPRLKNSLNGNAWWFSPAELALWRLVCVLSLLLFFFSSCSVASSFFFVNFCRLCRSASFFSCFFFASYAFS